MWINGRVDEPRSLLSGIASDATVAEASLIPLESIRVMWVNGRADEPRRLLSGIASDAAVAEASPIPLE